MNYDDDSIVMGVITHSNRMFCNECLKEFTVGDNIYTDTSQCDYDICKRCYFGDLL